MKTNVIHPTQTHITGNSAAQKATPSAKPRAGARLTIAGLLLLSVIPLIFGVVRLAQLAGGAEITPANARFFTSPLPVVVHIVNAGIFALLGAFQFAASFRRRHPRWHRAAGRLLVGCGLLVGLSALWMTLFYARAPGTGDLLFALRLVFGSGMVLAIILGFAAVRRHDLAGHRAWMMRAYAIGLGAGTQMLTLMVGEMLAGKPNELTHALLMGAGWVINLAVAEWAIRRRPSARTRPAAAAVNF